MMHDATPAETTPENAVQQLHEVIGFVQETEIFGFSFQGCKNPPRRPRGDYSTVLVRKLHKSRIRQVGHAGLRALQT